MQTLDLIVDLIKITEENKIQAERLFEYPISKLKRKKNAKSWNALECIEHLNRYGDFYIPEIRTRIQSSKHPKSVQFKPGVLGNYFAQSMLPKNRPNKMKTFKVMDPLECRLESNVIHKFIEQQNSLLEILNEVKNHDLTRIKTSVSISKFIKLRLGDTLRVVIFHNLRHIEQAKRATVE